MARLNGHPNLLRSAAAGAISLAMAGSVAAAELPITTSDAETGPVTFQLIDDSRLGCGQGVALWTANSGGVQCAFDTATRGASMTARQDLGRSSFETYATMARTTTGAFTPDQLLINPRQRSSESTNFLLVGLKGSLHDERLRVTAEFASTDRVSDALVGRGADYADVISRRGGSAKLGFDAKLIEKPGLKWSLAGEYRTVSSDYYVGRSTDLARHFALPGSRLSLSSRVRMGDIGLSAALEQARSPFGENRSRKAGIDYAGVSLRLVSRDSRAAPLEGSSLLDSRSTSDSIYIDLDTLSLAAVLLPEVGELPFFVPASVNLSIRSGETDSRYASHSTRYDRSSFGVDGNWETPIGETTLSYWRDARNGLTGESDSWTSETYEVSHAVRRGNWRFGLDASLTRGSGDMSSGYKESALSFGQSVAYSVPDGPELRVQFGQDRGTFHMRDDSYSSAGSYSRITASLDLSRYLQKRFERPDLRLTLDYRKAVDRTDAEMNLYDELAERWTDGDRREGFLVSFGMKL